MTHTSFSKITDLILPARAKGKSPDRSTPPGAAKDFERLLQTVSERNSGAIDQAKRPKGQPFEPPRSTVRHDRSVADRQRSEPKRPDRSEDPVRVDADRPDTKPAGDADPVDRQEAKDSDVAEDNDPEGRAADREDSEHQPDDEGDGGETQGDTDTRAEAEVQVEGDGSGDAEAEMTALLTDTSAEAEAEVAVADQAAGGDAQTVIAATGESDPEVTDDQQADGDETVEQAAAMAAAAAVGAEQVAPLATTDATAKAIGEEATIEETATTSESLSVEVSVDGETGQGPGDGSPQAALAQIDDEAVTADGQDVVANTESGAQSQSDGGPTSNGDQPTTSGPPIATATTVSNAATATVAAATTGITTPAAGETTATSATSAAAQAARTGEAVDTEDGDLLWRQVRRAIGSMRTIANGEQQMTIRLRPAELGAVMIRINTGEAGTTVALVAESAAAANQLNQQRQQLISELEDGGLTEVAVDVGTSDNPETDGEDSEGDNGGGTGDGLSALADQTGEPNERFQTGRANANAGLVDLDL